MFACPLCKSNNLEANFIESFDYTIDENGNLDEIDGAQDIVEVTIMCRDCDNNLNEYLKYDFESNKIVKS